MEENLKIWNDAKRIVVKSRLFFSDKMKVTGVDTEAIARWTAQIAKLQEMGKQVVWVSSGAVAEGMARLGWTKTSEKNARTPGSRSCRTNGYCRSLRKSFERYDIRTAQILLTHADLADRERYLNARQTLTTLLDLKVVPIINENDTVVTNEIKVGDNDTLGALVTNLIDADVLVILTDQIGLFTADPRSNPEAKLVEVAKPEIRSMKQWPERRFFHW